jgi:6-pyruvoyltetrahydropterin/6-carboxytetrahydropterin synthase
LSTIETTGETASPFTLTQVFFFESAHTLRRDIEAAGSRRVHGHTYYCEVQVKGSVNPHTGMVVDLGLVREKIERVRNLLDHHFLDEVVGLGIPTLENLSYFIYQRLQTDLPQLHAVRVWRKAMGDGCTYCPN